MLFQNNQCANTAWPNGLDGGGMFCANYSQKQNNNNKIINTMTIKASKMHLVEQQDMANN